MTHEQFFDEHPPEIRALALAACALIQRFVPNAVEIINPGHRVVTYGKGENMMAQLCYVAAFKNHINIGFENGTELADPRMLLEGTGKRLRHVKIRQAEDLDNPALHDLIRASLKDITS